LIDPGLWLRRSSTWGQAGIEALVRIAYIALRMLNVACLTEILKVKCFGGFISYLVRGKREFKIIYMTLEYSLRIGEMKDGRGKNICRQESQT